MRDKNKIKQTLLSSKSESIDSVLESETTIGLHEYVDGNFAVIVVRDSIVIDMDEMKSKKVAKKTFIDKQMKYFSKIIQRTDQLEVI